MTDATEEQKQKDLRLVAVTKALEGLLEDDDRFLVRQVEDRVVVTPENEGHRAELRQSNPELYGRLASANERIGGAVGAVGWGFLTGAALSIALHLGAFDGLIGDEASAALRELWVYALIVLVLMVIAGKLASVRGGRVYCLKRPEILAAIDGAHLSRHALIADLQDDSGVEALVKHLKRDDEADGGRSYP